MTRVDPKKVNAAAIRWLVGRMHVCTPYLDVARDIYRRCRAVHWDRPARKEALRIALEAHKANRDLVRELRL
jgi:hypothetical protein